MGASTRHHRRGFIPSLIAISLLIALIFFKKKPKHKAKWDITKITFFKLRETGVKSILRGTLCLEEKIGSRVFS